MFPGLAENFRVFLKPGATDMRKSINGLSLLAQEKMKLDPFGGSLFVFCNRRRNLMKTVYWDSNGFCLWLKRLEKDKFRWPQTPDECLEITSEQLRWLFHGLDFRTAHRRLHYSSLA